MAKQLINEGKVFVLYSRETGDFISHDEQSYEAYKKHSEASGSDGGFEDVSKMFQSIKPETFPEKLRDLLEVAGGKNWDDNKTFDLKDYADKWISLAQSDKKPEELSKLMITELNDVIDTDKFVIPDSTLEEKYKDNPDMLSMAKELRKDGLRVDNARDNAYKSYLKQMSSRGEIALDSMLALALTTIINPKKIKTLHRYGGWKAILSAYPPNVGFFRMSAVRRDLYEKVGALDSSARKVAIERIKLTKDKIETKIDQIEKALKGKNKGDKPNFLERRKLKSYKKELEQIEKDTKNAKKIDKSSTAKLEKTANALEKAVEDQNSTVDKFLESEVDKQEKSPKVEKGDDDSKDKAEKNEDDGKDDPEKDGADEEDEVEKDDDDVEKDDDSPEDEDDDVEKDSDDVDKDDDTEEKDDEDEKDVEKDNENPEDVDAEKNNDDVDKNDDAPEKSGKEKKFDLLNDYKDAEDKINDNIDRADELLKDKSVSKEDKEKIKDWKKSVDKVFKDLSKEVDEKTDTISALKKWGNKFNEKNDEFKKISNPGKLENDIEKSVEAKDERDGILDKINAIDLENLKKGTGDKDERDKLSNELKDKFGMSDREIDKALYERDVEKNKNDEDDLETENESNDEQEVEKDPFDVSEDNEDQFEQVEFPNDIENEPSDNGDDVELQDLENPYGDLNEDFEVGEYGSADDEYTDEVEYDVEEPLDEIENDDESQNLESDNELDDTPDADEDITEQEDLNQDLNNDVEDSADEIKTDINDPADTPGAEVELPEEPEVENAEDSGKVEPETDDIEVNEGDKKEGDNEISDVLEGLRGLVPDDKLADYEALLGEAAKVDTTTNEKMLPQDILDIEVNPDATYNKETGEVEISIADDIEMTLQSTEGKTDLSKVELRFEDTEIKFKEIETSERMFYKAGGETNRGKTFYKKTSIEDVLAYAYENSTKGVEINGVEMTPQEAKEYMNDAMGLEIQGNKDEDKDKVEKQRDGIEASELLEAMNG